MNFKEIMEFNTPYNQKIFDSLVKDIKENKVVPYIGAGLSMLFENVYPSWGQFLNSTFEEYKISEQEKFNKLNYEDKAEYLYNEMGSITFSEHLKDIFGKQHLNINDNEFTKKAIYLLPIIFDKGLIITTNYDKVIEKIYELHNSLLSVAHPGHFESLNRAIRSDELLLYKIHGDIIEPIQSIILTKNQYKQAYENPKLIEILNQIYISKEMLFLGCSMQKDRPIELMYKVSKPGMYNYSIIPCESENIKERRLQLENEYYTKSIIYPKVKHECVKVILDEIAQNVNPEGYKKKLKIELDSQGNLSDLKLKLSDKWFYSQNKIQIKNLGNRYLPELNIELNEKNIFNALGRSESFYKNFIQKADEVLISLNDLEMSSIEKNIRIIYDRINQFSIENINKLNIEEIIDNLKHIDNEINQEYEKILIELENKSKKNKICMQNRLYSLRKAMSLVYQYIKYIDSKEIKVLNTPFVLLDGEGGIGKSHLLADIITNRNSDGKKSLLFLGQHFVKENNPFNQILEMLGLKCTANEFLKALNEIAEKDKSRIIIFIDALNEGNGKNIWKNHLGGILEIIKSYPWIGLVASIRTAYVDVLFDDNDLLKNDLINITHQGFLTLEYDAIKKYFDYYKISYNNIPFINQEFSNPLFLRLVCESFKDNVIDFDNIYFTDIYKKYLSEINLKIYNECGYSRHINIVEKVINEFVLYKYQNIRGNNFMPLDDVIKIIIKVERDYNIGKSLLDELLSNGIITQNINYKKEEYIYVTYEKLEDYLYAKLLVDDLEHIGIDEFNLKYNYLLRYGDILEALAIVLSENKNYEIFDLFVNQKEDYHIRNAFCNALKWRKSDTITQNTLDYINNVILKYNNGFKKIYNIFILISTKIGHKFSADFVIKNFLSKKMSDRDALYIPIFDEIYEDYTSSINRLLDWSLHRKNNEKISEEKIRLASIIISTFLISPNNILRDKSTKALVNLLNGHIDVLIEVLTKFENVDDPYILERLYGVAFGCVVSEKSITQIEKLALYVYDKIFNVGYVYPNILLRDYAKNIIDYAKYKTENKCIKELNVNPPYKSKFPKIPTDEEILKYNQDYYILHSMQVEYDRDGSWGGYGDFGRYVFQRYLSKWKNLNSLDYNDLKNIAIKKIFEMGYDKEKHGKYDRDVKVDYMSTNKKERIGKKYQWIALYELAAQVCDKYKIEIDVGCYGETEEIYCRGSFEPYIRNIDPTIFIDLNRTKKDNKFIHNKLYDICIKSEENWFSDFKDLPDINQLVNLNYKEKQFILLNGEYKWTEEKKLGNRNFKHPQRDMWIQINSYIVKSEQLDLFVNKLNKKDFMGRWLSEPNEENSIYNREYYWSEAHDFFENPYYCGNTWCNISEHRNIEGLEEKVLLPTCIYFSENKGDLLENNNSYVWYKPCKDLFYKLNMEYGEENSILYNKEGEMICFDSQELLGEDIGFFIDKKTFLQYLNENGYSVFWTILAEKRILGNRHSLYKGNKRYHISGVYRFDEKEDLIGNINIFEKQVYC